MQLSNCEDITNNKFAARDARDCQLTFGRGFELLGFLFPFPLPRPEENPQCVEAGFPLNCRGGFAEAVASGHSIRLLA